MFHLFLISTQLLEFLSTRFIMILVLCCLIRFFLSIFILHCINIIQYRYAECCTNTMDSVTSIYIYRFVFHRSLHLASHRTLLQDQYLSGWAQTQWRISMKKIINSSDGFKSFCNILPRITSTRNTSYFSWKHCYLAKITCIETVIETNLKNFSDRSPSTLRLKFLLKTVISQCSARVMCIIIKVYG